MFTLGDFVEEYGREKGLDLAVRRDRWHHLEHDPLGERVIEAVAAGIGSTWLGHFSDEGSHLQRTYLHRVYNNGPLFAIGKILGYASQASLVLTAAYVLEKM